jgi:hypothetical protein
MPPQPRRFLIVDNNEEESGALVQVLKSLAGCGKIVLSERFLSLLRRFVSFERFLAGIFRVVGAPRVRFRPCADTTALTHCAETVAAIRFRMRTRL